MQAVQLGTSAFQGKALQLRPVKVAQPFKAAVVPVRAEKTLQVRMSVPWAHLWLAPAVP